MRPPCGDPSRERTVVPEATTWVALKEGTTVMTAIAATAPLQVRRYAGIVWIAVLAGVVIVLATGAFVLGRVTGNDNGSTIQPVHTVFLQPAGANGVGQACRVHQPC